MSRGVQLWLAVLTGPLVWFASLLANFALTPQVCEGGGTAMLFGVMAVSLVLTASAGLLAWRLWRRTGVELPGESGGAAGYRRTMGLAGVLLSAMFFLVILAQSVPTFLLRGCE